MQILYLRHVQIKLRFLASTPQWGHQEMTSEIDAQSGCIGARVRPSLGHSQKANGGGTTLFLWQQGTIREKENLFTINLADQTSRLRN